MIISELEFYIGSAWTSRGLEVQYMIDESKKIKVILDELGVGKIHSVNNNSSHGSIKISFNDKEEEALFIIRQDIIV